MVLILGGNFMVFINFLFLLKNLLSCSEFVPYMPKERGRRRRRKGREGGALQLVHGGALFRVYLKQALSTPSNVGHNQLTRKNPASVIFFPS